MIYIIIPCFNESDAILSNLSKAIDIMARFPVSFVFLDNGSTDNSLEILKLNASNIKHLDVLHIPVNKGYGYGLKVAINFVMQRTDADHIGWTHGDGQTDLYDIAEVARVISNANSKESRSGIFKGIRLTGRKRSEILISKSLDIITSLIFLRKIREINAQPSVYVRDNLIQFQSYPDDLSFDIYAYLLANDKSEYRFGVSFPPRTQGVSSWNTGLFAKCLFMISTFKKILRAGLLNLRKR